jgi:penicillin-binding protein 1A
MGRKNKGSVLLGAAAVILVIGIIVGAGFAFFITRGIPEVDSLAFNQPMETTKVYASDGSLIQEYGAEKRILVPYTEVSPLFFDALIAVEDANFYKHHGISIRGVFRAVLRDVLERKAGQGGSTLTMQLARQYFLTPEKTVTRKLKEMILALNIERHYSKQQILEMYANKVCFGHGYYGIESASRFYFGKKAIQLNVEESALLAGLIQRPTYFSPKKYPDRAKERRNWVLLRMCKTGKLSQQECDRLAAKPLSLAESSVERGTGAYPAERVRIYLEAKYGEEQIYEKGLKVYTTINPRLQALAVRAIREGLRGYQHRRPYRGPKRGPEAPMESAETKLKAGDSYWATVKDVDVNGVAVSFGGQSYTLAKQNFKWYQSITPSIVFKNDDRVLVNVVNLSPLELQLDDTFEAQSALLSFDVKTGEVSALVGGSNFETTMFNRVMQAKRQTGSAVKPLIYATAFRDSFNISDTAIDQPTLFLYGTENPAQICSQGYIPHDFDKGFGGSVTLRRAIEHSINICAVHILNQVGYSKVIELMRKLHITADLKPYPSMGLGAFEITLWELTGAYGAFANNGVYVSPYFIKKVEDRNGNPLEEHKAVFEKVLEPEVAYVLVEAMKGVVKRGTAGSAADMKGNFAGKTGTTDDYTDAWFMGFNPNIVTGVWTGRDDHKTLGSMETGARAALPIWRTYMEVAAGGQETLNWKVPANIVYLPVCAETGLRAGMDSPCKSVVEEPFIKGREPQKVCTYSAHERIRLPYFLQRYGFNDGGKLAVSSSDLESLISLYPSILSRSGKEELQVTWGGETRTIKVEPQEAPEPASGQAVYSELPPEGSVKCGAVVEYINSKN